MNNAYKISVFRMARRYMIYVNALVWLLSLANGGDFYDPGLQRWTNRDPIKEKGGRNLLSAGICLPLRKIAQRIPLTHEG